MADQNLTPPAKPRGRKTLLASAILAAGLTFGPVMPAQAMFGVDTAALIPILKQVVDMIMKGTETTTTTTTQEGEKTRQTETKNTDRVVEKMDKIEEQRQKEKAADRAARTPGTPQDTDKASVAVTAAAAASSNFNKAIEFGRDALDQDQLGNYTQRKNDEIADAAEVKPGQNDKAAEEKIAKLLTPEPMISGVAVRGKDSIFNPDNARSEEDVQAVVKALVGASELPLVDKYALKTRQGQEAQAAIFTQFARQQLAASAVYPTFSKDTLNALNEQYKSYVLTPPEDIFGEGVGEAQRLKMLIMLQQGTNDLLINLRVSLLEQNRLLGVLVAQQQSGNGQIAQAAGAQ